MSGAVGVYLEFYGYYSKIAGKKQEKIYISSELKRGIQDVREYIKDSYSIHDGFMMMKNNINIISLLRSNEPVAIIEGDMFKIIPIFSGG